MLTGVSGSGKSTLAFDIIFAEGQRRFMESMSAYARQFVEQLPRPEVDQMTGVLPTVAVEQRVTRGTAKSTVATITEVAQYLRLLFARIASSTRLNQACGFKIAARINCSRHCTSGCKQPAKGDPKQNSKSDADNSPLSTSVPR